jgi:hypothetical protein
MWPMRARPHDNDYIVFEGRRRVFATAPRLALMEGGTRIAMETNE